MDYSNSKLIAMHAGLAKIQTGTFKIVHTIDLQSYDDVIRQFENNISKNTTSHPLIPYLTFTISQIKAHISRLKPKLRSRRSLDFLGTAWKWLAGSPDHHDYEIVQKKMENILENNNNQIIINQLSIEKINKLTNMSNEIVQVLKSEHYQQNERISEIKYKLEILKDEIANIEFAIHLAKVNVVNSFILSSIELNILDDIFDKENIPFSSTDELLHFSKVKIATEGQNIVYIISIPTTGPENCQKILIKPLKNGNNVIKIDFKYVLNCKDKMLGIKEMCEFYNSLNICNLEKIVDISESNCIPNLLKSQKSKCTTTNGEHVSTVEEIEEGMLMLNQFIGEIEADNSTLRLNGSYVIHHYNSTIRINGRAYQSNQISGTKPLPALVQPMENYDQEKTLSLEMVNKMNINNSELLDELDVKSRISLSLNFGLIAALSTLVVIFTIKHMKGKLVTTTTDVPKNRGEATNNQHHDVESQNVNTKKSASENRAQQQYDQFHEGQAESKQKSKTKSIHSLPFF